MTTDPVPTHQPGLPEPGPLLTRVFPIVVYPGLIASIFLYPDFWLFMTRKEGGIEWMSVACLLVGIVYAIVMLVRHRAALPRKWLVGWYALAALGMFVLAGEEISWGQHLGLWKGDDLPEAWRELNDQNETNLHNLSNALDQGPTNLVVAGTFFAFAILPIIQRVKRQTMAFDNPGYWFWPTRAGLFAAIGVLVIPFPKRIYEWVNGHDAPTEWRHSEIHEFYIALLMMTYIISAYYRLRAFHRDRPSRVAAP